MAPPPARPYIFNRIVAVIGVVAWNVLGFAWTFSDNPVLGWGMFAVAPLALWALSLISSAGVYKLPFSAFGPKRRTALPKRPVHRSRIVGGSIAWTRSSFIRWMVFEEGIGFKAYGIGSGFVPFSSITETKKQLFGGLKVKHESNEVRSPLRIPSRKIRKAVEKQLASEFGR